MIIALSKIFAKYKIPYALVGGHAVSLHGAVRGTIDIDVITKWNLKNLKNIEKALEEIGLTPRLPITAEDLFKFKEEYIRNKNLIAWNFINPQKPSEQVDVIITIDLTGKKVKNIKTSQGTLKVLSVEDLINMKKDSGREQDLLDVEALEKLYEK
ncbi:MAG: hypothetical protein H6621_10060 [Halobacteriovoraceae bacterium]|nr:hypothetical protein [Halobacteriovoraceae bacterium]MCB9095401.1 hypothetical protein [Halobacteriovoraceae bacterium]